MIPSITDIPYLTQSFELYLKSIKLIHFMYIILRNFSLLVLLTLLSHIVFSQRTCGTEKVMQKTGIDQIEIISQNAKIFAEWKKSQTLLRDVDTIVIPVHIIIVHSTENAIGEGDNFSFERIQSQIDVLNEDFARKNANSIDTPTDFNAAATAIQFCLANVDPNGNPSNGITRYATDDDFEANEIDIMESTIWDRNKYLNIYSAFLSSGLLGYSPVPTASSLPSDADGDAIVVFNAAFGGPGFSALAPYDLGRTTTHEVGHWLGLNHVWGPTESSCLIDDGLDDTPIQETFNEGCPNHPSPSCNNNGDMFMNFMDYVNDECMNAFSRDQADYMYFILQEVRTGLLNSANTNCSSPNLPIASIDNIVHLECADGTNASVSLIVEGGTAPYSFTLDGTINQTGDFSNLSAGSYDIVIEDSIGGSSIFNFTIDAPQPIIVGITPGVLPCQGLENGSFLVNVTGGTGDYIILLNDEIESNNGLFENLSSGPYDIYVYDDNECLTIENFTLQRDNPFNISGTETTGNNCTDFFNSGSIFIQASSANGEIISYAITGESNTTGFFENLDAGDYQISITDEIGCINQSVVNVPSINPETCPELLINVINVENISCNGLEDGSISYNVVNSLGNSSVTLNGVEVTGQEIDGLSAGMYNLVAMDEAGRATDFQFDITEPQPIIIENISTENANCAVGGTVVVSVSGGQGILTYNLDQFSSVSGTLSPIPSGTYTLTVTDQNNCSVGAEVVVSENTNSLSATYDVIQNLNCSNPTSAAVRINPAGGTPPYLYIYDDIISDSEIINGLGEGQKNVIVEDSNGCRYEVNIIIDPVTSLVVDLTILSNPGCEDSFNGSVLLQTQNGVSPVNYSLQFGNEIIASNQTGIFENLENGTYTYTVIDASDCTSEGSFELSIESNNNLSVSQTILPSCANSNDGTIVLTHNTSNPPYQYLFNGIEIEGPILENIIAGMHTIELINGDNCSSIIEVDLPSDDSFSISVPDFIVASCSNVADASFLITTEGGTAPFSYFIDGEESESPFIENQSAGQHEIIVEDFLGCQANLTFEIGIDSDLTITIMSVEIPSCDNNGNGSMAIQGNGGTSPYDYSVNGVTNSIGAFGNLEVGEQNILISDANGCTIDSLVIFEPYSNYEVIIETTDISCYGLNDGSFTVTTIPASSFSLSSSNPDILNNPQMLGADDYSIVVITNDGCVEEIDFSILEPDSLSLNVLYIENVVDTPGRAGFEAIGGNPPYEYQVGEQSNVDGIFENLDIGDYNLLITDANDCEINFPFTIDLETSYLELIKEKIKIYPNPVSSKIHIDFENLASDWELTLINTIGQSIMSKTIEKSNSEIDITHLTEGVYFIKLINGDKRINTSIIKQ